MRKMEANNNNKKEEIKKGPWKAEEDEVLINHVKRYGPRDWSSIRSKGLLHRTGKSCRLRWVNKLRPNLKNGCKFSADEERVVIELQSDFGNKWARIATYLPGRTDNDVKNFWSSRQKRLARILHNSSSDASTSKSSSSSSHRCKGKHVKPIRQSCNPTQGFSLVEEEEITVSSSSSLMKVPYSSSDQVDDKALRLPDLGIKFEHQPFTFGTDLVIAEFSDSPNDADQQALIPFSPESRELLARLDDPFYYDILGPADSSEPLFALPQPFFEPSPAPRRCRHVSKDEEPDVFLDDFPADMFDQVDPIRTP
ncbi:PREDICTED: myb-related protein 305-like [Camelina sativa]|uniref:Myb-related protein 305-like n=1 Tax=Camelina sativa TaxID=90675 RepID=A0ABM0WCP4_CAMSA|nr:PREDICTED: myb-related protein 305-like [Camelina sativa]